MILRGVLGLVGLVLCALAAAPQAFSQADGAVDREALIFFLRDSKKSMEYARDAEDLFAALSRASAWVDDAGANNVNLSEAIVHARTVLDRVAREVPQLADRLDSFPANGPSFPPVFQWIDDWTEWSRSSLDAMEVEAGHLDAQIAALNARDYDRLDRILTAREADRATYQAYYASADKIYIDALPEGHPQRLIARLDLELRELSAVNSERNQTIDEDAYRALTLQLAESYREAAEGIRRKAGDLDAAIAAQRPHVLRLVAALTRDPVTAEAVTDAYQAAYQAYAQDMIEYADTVEEYARLELLLYRDGVSAELFEAFARAGARNEDYYRRRTMHALGQIDILLNAAVD
jgi:hypothetical protein